MADRKHSRALLVAIAVSAGAPAMAIEDPLGTSGASSGGVGLADPRSNDAMVLNPATLGLRERYDVLAWGEIGGGILAGAFSVVDSRQSDRIALGVGYRYARANPPFTASDLPGWIAEGEELTNRQRYHDVTVGFAFPISDRRVSFGVGGGVSKVNKERRGDYFDGDLDLGVAFGPKEWLAFGVSALDVIPVPGSTDHPARIAAGAWVGEDEVGSFEIDAKVRVEAGEGSRLALGAGFSRAVGAAAEIRGGWRYDGERTRHVAALGLGFASEATWLDLGVEVPFSTPFSARDLVVRVGFRARD